MLGATQHQFNGKLNITRR